MLVNYTKIAQLLLLCCIVIRSYVLCEAESSQTQLHKGEQQIIERNKYLTWDFWKQIVIIIPSKVYWESQPSAENSDSGLSVWTDWLVGRDIKSDSGNEGQNYVRVAQNDISHETDERDQSSEEKVDLSHPDNLGSKKASLPFYCTFLNFLKIKLPSCTKAAAAKSNQKRALSPIATSRDNYQKVVKNNSRTENLMYVYAKPYDPSRTSFHNYYQTLKNGSTQEKVAYVYDKSYNQSTTVSPAAMYVYAKPYDPSRPSFHNYYQSLKNGSTQEKVAYVYDKSYNQSTAVSPAAMYVYAKPYDPSNITSFDNYYQTLKNNSTQVAYVYGKPYNQFTAVSPAATSPDNYHRTVENNSASKMRNERDVPDEFSDTSNESSVTSNSWFTLHNLNLNLGFNRIKSLKNASFSINGLISEFGIVTLLDNQTVENNSASEMHNMRDIPAESSDHSTVSPIAMSSDNHQTVENSAPEMHIMPFKINDTVTQRNEVNIYSRYSKVVHHSPKPIY